MLRKDNKVVLRRVTHIKKFFRRWDWLLVVVIAPLLLFPQPGMIWSLLMLPFILLEQWWAWAEILPVTPLNPAILLMGFMTGVSIYVTPDLLTSLGKVTGVLLGILVYFTVARYSKSRQGWKRSLIGITIAGMGVSAIGLVGTTWLPSKITGLNTFLTNIPIRLIGLPGAENGINANELAGALLWVVPLLFLAGIALLIEPKWLTDENSDGKIKKTRFTTWLIFLGIAIITCAGVLVLSQSRDGYIAMIVALPLLLFLISKSWSRYLVAGLLILLVMTGVVITNHAGIEWVANPLLGTLPAKGTVFSPDTMFGRVEIWSRAIMAIREVPLTGLGMNVFRRAVYLQEPPFQDTSFDIAHAHNELLQAAVDLGLPGLVGFLALYFTAIGMLVRPIRNRGAIRLLALGLLGGLMTHSIFGLTDAVALGAKPGFLLWWLFGLIAGLYEQTRPVRESIQA